MWFRGWLLNVSASIWTSGRPGRCHKLERDWAAIDQRIAQREQERLEAYEAAAKVQHDRERKRASMQVWRAENRQRSRALNRESYARHREETRVQQKAYRAARRAAEAP